MKVHLDPHTETQIEKRAARRDRKRRPKMKVSGAGVKKLQRILINKSHKY